MFRIVFSMFAPMLAFTMIVLSSSPASAAVEAYIFRGAGDFSFIAKPLTFSEGMDRIGEKFEQAGVRSTVYRWQAGEWAYRDIMKRRPEAVAIAGHSMGALTAIALANRLKNSGIRVVYMGLIDIPGPAGICPPNVEVAENFYHAFPVYGRLTKGSNHKGIVRNTLIWGQIHITMDNSTKVHDAMLAAVAEFRDENSVMQAYASTEDEGPAVLDQVDDLLTASTEPSSQSETNETASTEPANLISAASTSNSPVLGVTVDPAIHLTALSADVIPVPTPRPYRHDTKSGLPPIE